MEVIVKELVAGLSNKNPNEAYRCLKELVEISERSNEVYYYFDLFEEMLDHPNSYLRTRGFVLIAANAKWDVDNKIDEIIDSYLTHITDDSPITARQCIKALPSIIKYKPELKEDVECALRNANTARYKDSMQPLIAKDIQKILGIIVGS